MARSSTSGHPLQGCRVLLFVRLGCSGPPCPLCEALLLQWDVDIAADTLIWRADRFCIPHLERLCGPVGRVSSLLSPGCGGVAWKVWSLRVTRRLLLFCCCAPPMGGAHACEFMCFEGSERLLGWSRDRGRRERVDARVPPPPPPSPPITCAGQAARRPPLPLRLWSAGDAGTEGWRRPARAFLLR